MGHCDEQVMQSLMGRDSLFPVKMQLLFHEVHKRSPVLKFSRSLVDPAHISQRKIIICLSNQLVLIESLVKQQGESKSTRSSRELGRSIKLFHSIGSMYWVYFPARRRWSSTSTLHFVCRQDHSTESHQLTL